MVAEISFENISFERDNQFLFRGLSGELIPGEALQIQGQNGTGKSTLLRILAGLLEPQYGKIFWHRQDIRTVQAAYQRQFFYVGHHNHLKPLLTVRENLQLMLALHQLSLSCSLKSILGPLGLQNSLDTLCKHLSAGQMRRLSLAKLLFSPRPLWILDEPMTTLDAQTQAWLRALLNQHLATQGMLLIATHQPLQLDKKIHCLLLEAN